MTPKSNFQSLLDELFASPSPESVARAQAALKARLQAELPPTAWYDFVPETPIGPLWLAVSEAGLASIHYGREPEAWLKALRRRGFGALERSAGRTRQARSQILQYLSGRRTTFETPVDWRGVSEFQRRVLEWTAAVPRGQVTTYNAIAARLGKPRAARAVGQALRHNPVPLVVPCHRVVAVDGGLRGYAGKSGVDRKAWLLRLEGARP
jgi:methylated-DNA-[protein]-cysteine S-methyltransferase